MLICPLYFYYIYAAKLHQNRKSTPYQRFNRTTTLKKLRCDVARFVDTSHATAYRRPPPHDAPREVAVSAVLGRLLPEHTRSDQRTQPLDVDLLVQQNYPIVTQSHVSDVILNAALPA